MTSSLTRVQTSLTQRRSYPETAGRTLEEIQEIFDGPGAVSAVVEAELDHQAVELDKDGKHHQDDEFVEDVKV